MVPATEPVRIFLVDDSPEFIRSAENFLAGETKVKVVGHATSGQEALAKISGCRPDLVLMDLAMPGMNGLVTIARLRAMTGSTRMVILTLHDSLEYRTAAAQVGADGFISKTDFAVDLFSLIRTLFSKGDRAG
ncbi:MAG: response regulator transcription factor [Deltaproteobacteria bacterium]|nr:response regulator transcription factor [Deltaproteobacteria bacterium]